MNGASAARATLLVLVLLLINILNFMDRVAIGVLGGVIRTDLALSGAQFGLVTGAAFSAAYALSALPMARLADRTGRAKVLMLCITLWSIAMIVGATAHGFPMLAVSRLMVALGESAAAAICYSIVIAQLPAAHRATAVAVVALGAPLGSFVGGATFASLGAAYGWRTVFYGAGFAGLLLVPCVWLVIQRLADEKSASEPPAGGFWSCLLRVATHKEQTRLALLYFAVAMVMTSVVAWMPQILQNWRNLSLAQSGSAFGMAMLFGGTAGTFVIPALLARWSGGDNMLALRRGMKLLPLGIAGLGLSLWPIVSNYTLVLGIGIALVTCALPLLFASIPDVAEEQGITETNAAVFLPGNLFATSVGPLAVGLVSDSMLGGNQTSGAVAGLLMVLGLSMVLIAFVMSSRQPRALVA